MEMSNKEVVENLKAQIKCVQSDIFTGLKRYIKIFSFDATLKAIVNEPYYSINQKKYTIGLDGKKKYGVIDSYSPEKRNEIIKKLKAHLINDSMDSDQKIVDIELIVLHYQKAGNAVKNTVLVPLLKALLRELHCFCRVMQEAESAVSKRLN